jgi:trimeric autotransporter adhesin
MAEGMMASRALGGKLAAAALLVVAAVAGTAGAQCQREWLPGAELAGTDGPIRASTVWDPDGPGPETSKIVFAGQFSTAGGVRANSIAVYDPETDEWSALPQQFPVPFGNIIGISPTADGGLVVVGDFSLPQNRREYIYRWNRVAWTSIPVGEFWVSSTFGPIQAAVEMPNGDIVVGGAFTRIGGVQSFKLARWNGTAWVEWSPTGTGFSSASDEWVFALAVTPNGDLIVGGRFFRVGNAQGGLIARWNGAEWSTLGGTNFAAGSNSVTTIRVLPNGFILASGTFDLPLGGSNRIRGIGLFNGTNWANLGDGLPTLFGVYASDIAPNGDVLIVAQTAFTGTRHFRRTGFTWTDLGQADQSTQPITATIRAVGSNQFLIGGRFLQQPNGNSLNFFRWNGERFTATGNGPTSIINSITQLPDGDLIAAGAFRASGGQPFSRIARRSGDQWFPLGSGLDNTVNSVEILPNGDLVAGGFFTAAGGTPASRIAQWNGSAWSPLGAGLDNTVNKVAVLPNGNIVAVGSFLTTGGQPARGAALWNGTAWSALGGGLNGDGSAVLVLPSGEIIVGGTFTAAGDVPANNIARWDGTAWTAFGQGVNGTVRSLRQLSGGEIVAGGSFTGADGSPANKIAAWNGIFWTPLGPGVSFDSVDALTVLDGQLVAAGRSSNGRPSSVARWDGSEWRLLGGTVRGFLDNTSILIQDMEVTSGGELIVAGFFTGWDDVVTPYLATWACRCRADFDGNGTLDFFDYLDFVASFAAGESRADFDRNGTVDFFDYLDFAAAFDAGCA